MYIPFRNNRGNETKITYSYYFVLHFFLFLLLFISLFLFLHMCLLVLRCVILFFFFFALFFFALGDFFLEGGGPLWMRAVVLYAFFFMLLSFFMIIVNFAWNCISANKNENESGNESINENTRIVKKSPIFSNFRNSKLAEKPNYSTEFERLIVRANSDNDDDTSQKKSFSTSIDSILI